MGRQSMRGELHACGRGCEAAGYGLIDDTALSCERQCSMSCAWQCQKKKKKKSLSLIGLKVCAFRDIKEIRQPTSRGRFLQLHGNSPLLPGTLEPGRHRVVLACCVLADVTGAICSTPVVNDFSL
jgi:hypothetical protein